MNFGSLEFKLILIKFIFIFAIFYRYIAYDFTSVDFNYSIKSAFYTYQSFLGSDLDNFNENINEEYSIETHPSGNKIVNYNIKIPHFGKESLETLENLHKKALQCLKDSDSPYGYEEIPFETDFKKREEHYEWLKKETEKYRNITMFCWEGYCGKWIENVWIDTFINEKLSTFGPYIPLFIPWNSQWSLLKEYKYKFLVKEILSLLKPNYLYITVSLNDFGVEGSRRVFSEEDHFPKNLVVLAANGRGHVPLPELKQLEQPREMKPYKYEASFIGFMQYANRQKVVNFFKEKMHDKFFSSWREKDWNAINEVSKVILSPRGFGRNCFRTYEMLQQGYVPVVLYDDYYWLPYRNSSFPWDEVAIVSDNDHLEEVYEKIMSIDENERQRYRENMFKYRKYFTYYGVMEQIAFFMHGQGFLRCDKYYKTINPFDKVY